MLHLGKFYPPVRGGMETALQTLCAGQSEAIQSRALVMNRGRKTTHDVVEGVKVTRVASWVTVGAVAVAPGLPLWLARADADVIVIHEPNPMALLAYFIVRPATPLIVWYHSEVIRPRSPLPAVLPALAGFALRRAARIVVASPPMSNAPALAAHADNARSSPSGWSRRAIWRRRRFPSTPRRCDKRSAGRSCSSSDGSWRTRASTCCSRRWSTSMRSWLIVGDGPRRAGHPGTHRRARTRRSGARSLAKSPMTSCLAWLHACDALVLPSTTRQEAFGMVQLEAMMCGRPVISTDLPTGVPWVNVNGLTGLVVAAGDVAALRTRFNGLSPTGPAQRQWARRPGSARQGLHRRQDAFSSRKPVREVSQACS